VPIGRLALDSPQPDRTQPGRKLNLTAG